MVALPLAATWIGDASAVVAGSAWGRERAKLAPTISPNKSWVGFWAALLGGAGAAVLWLAIAVRHVPELEPVPFAAMAVGGALLAFAAVLGDLAESLLKREAGVKDSGTFFPGHGGVLDRIDSLIFTLPGAYGVLLLLTWLT
jgi:phosphatidate cytidylyltransferase